MSIHKLASIKQNHMKSTFAKNIYHKKYEGQISYDQFMAYLAKGLSLLKNCNPAKMNDKDIIAMNIAMDYNMETIVRQVSSSKEYYD